jgi:creatinine amidohydrolase
MIRYFIQNQLEKKKDYIIYFFEPDIPLKIADQIKATRKSDRSNDKHGGEREASEILYLRPELIKLNRSKEESGDNQARLKLPKTLYTAIWCYASYPNHYADQAEYASKKLGRIVTENTVSSSTNAIKVVKEDSISIEIQKEYFEKVK